MASESGETTKTESDGSQYIMSSDEDSLGNPKKISAKKTPKAGNRSTTPSSSSCDDESNPYLRLRQERVRANRDRLISLGLLAADGSSNNLLDNSTTTQRIMSTPVSTASVALRKSSRSSTCASPRLPVRKIPRLAQRTIDLSEDPPPSLTTNISPGVAGLNLNTPVAEITQAEEVQATVVPPTKRRLYSSETAKQANAVGKARKRMNVEEFGEVKVIHPVKLKTIERTRDGMIKESSQDLFLSACEAFVSHHAEYPCRNYQKKTYGTTCDCLQQVIHGENSARKVKLVAQALLEF